MTKFISWNVNGLRAVCKKGFKEIFEQLDADYFCLQETKLSPGVFNLEFPGYESFWNYAERKGYSGTAIFARRKPLDVSYGMGIEEHDREGRVITLEAEEFFLVNVYTPNSQMGLARLAYRQEWDRAFMEYVTALDRKKPVIICGDFNVAISDLDLSEPAKDRGLAGSTDEERDTFSQLLGSGFVDTFRHFNPDAEGQYSWWSYMRQSRQRNRGWRVDYFLLSRKLLPALKEAKILRDITGSDHCPVEIALDLKGQ